MSAPNHAPTSDRPADAGAGWDAIVIGSGIGGLCAATGLARAGRRVLVLEQHSEPGGMTQTFERQGWRFATGVHYVGGLGPDAGPGGSFGRLLKWLGDGSLRFVPLPSRHDVVRLRGDRHPGGELRFGFGAPESDNFARLAAQFPHEAEALRRYARAFERAQKDAGRLFMLHGLPKPAAALLRWLIGGRLRRAAQVTVSQALSGIHDPDLRDLLAARGADYGLAPDEAPLLLHATVLGSYQWGAWLPEGGPKALARSLGAALQTAGGELRTSAAVQAIVVEQGRAVGVRLADGRVERAPAIVSTMGARNTVDALPPDAAPDWQARLRTLPLSRAYLSLYIGLDGDPREAGVDGANHWIYEGRPDAIEWTDPLETDAPALFVSFGSLPDTAHAGGAARGHTAEVLVLVPWSLFEPWADSALGRRPEDYLATKGWIEDRLLSQFKRLFPGLAGRVAFHELATPLTQAAYARIPQGAMYGLRMSAERLLEPALHVRTPVPGLLLGGQDVTSLGVQGAGIGGFMAAATLEPRLWKRLSA